MGRKLFALCLKSVMENDACVEQKTGDAAVDQVKQQPAATAPFRYTKVMRNTNRVHHLEALQNSY